MLHADLIGFVE